MIADVSFQGRHASFVVENADDHIQSCWINSHKFYEEDLLEFFFRYTMPGMRLLDVGAHHGNHTIFFAKILGQSVVAIEPLPESFDRLERNVAENGCEGLVELKRFAASDRVGNGNNCNEDLRNTGKNRIVHDPAGQTPVRRIDDEVSGTVSIIKVDVEGMELEVLKGAAATLRKWRPLVVVECQDAQAFGAVNAFLRPLGYRPLMRFCWTPTYVFIRARPNWWDWLFVAST